MVRFFTLFLLITILCQTAIAKSHTPGILRDVVNQVTLAASEGRVPVVLFDLDDTLINTRERNLRILKEYATTLGGPEAEIIRAVRLDQVRYNVTDTLKSIGLTDEKLLADADVFWAARFFTNAYCAADQENPGAAKYLRVLQRAGARLVYLTGRDAPGMKEGTLKSFDGNLFPESGFVLLMKPEFKMNDLEFKKQAFAEIAKMGEVIAVFENEPANLNAMLVAFPAATAVFLDTIHSPKPDVPVMAAFWVGDFIF